LGPHSYDPGVSQTGVTWVTAIPDGSARVDLANGEASLHVRNVCVLDAFTVANSLTVTRPLGNPVAAVMSVDIVWAGVRRRVSFSDSIDKFAGDFVETSATIDVVVTTLASTGHGFRFASDPAQTTITHFAQIGSEHNGVFF
jgi:hypothetical protein